MLSCHAGNATCCGPILVTAASSGYVFGQRASSNRPSSPRCSLIYCVMHFGFATVVCTMPKDFWLTPTSHDKDRCGLCRCQTLLCWNRAGQQLCTARPPSNLDRTVDPVDQEPSWKPTCSVQYVLLSSKHWSYAGLNFPLLPFQCCPCCFSCNLSADGEGDAADGEVTTVGYADIVVFRFHAYQAHALKV
jgi:hypothetical protein